MTISDIADYLGYEIIGDASQEVTGISFADTAGASDIAIAYREQDIHNTKAHTVLTAPVLCDTDKCLMLCHESVGKALSKIVSMFIKNGLYVDYSVPVAARKYNDYYMGKGCKIGKGVSIGSSAVIENDVEIGDGCVISHSSVIKSGSCLGKNVHIGISSVIGADAFWTYKEKDSLEIFVGVGRAIIEDDVYIGNFTNVERGTLCDTVIKSGTKISNFVQVGHDSVVGHNCKIVSQCGFAGGVTIGNDVTVFGQVGIANNIRVGDKATIRAKSGVAKSIQRGADVSGIYARDHVKELETISKLRKL